MKVIIGKKYISDKEASLRYGYSVGWFRKRRRLKLPPKYVRLESKGRVFYPLEETEQWFVDNIRYSY